MKKKSIVLIATVVMLSAALIIGGTLAYFTDTKTATNTFTVGNVNITLDEAPVTSQTTNGLVNYVKADGARVTGNKYEGLAPGSTAYKDPTVTNTGANAAYVRATVVITVADASKAKAGLSTILGDIQEGWVQDTSKTKTVGNTITLVYNHTNALNAQEAATLFKEVKIPTTFANDDVAALGDFKITITAEAIQANGFEDNAAGAFTALDSAMAHAVN